MPVDGVQKRVRSWFRLEERVFGTRKRSGSAGRAYSPVSFPRSPRSRMWRRVRPHSPRSPSPPARVADSYRGGVIDVSAVHSVKFDADGY